MSCGGEVGEDAVAHLGGGFVGKGDGEDLLGLLDGGVGEQLEQALDEQAGLARAGRGFDDEGAADVECLAAGIGVGRRGGWAGGKRRSSATGVLRACGIEGAGQVGVGTGVGIFVQRVGVERGGVEAAEQALLAVGAGLRVLLGVDARLAGVEVFGERGEHLAPLVDLRFEAFGFQLRGLGEDSLVGFVAVQAHVFAGRTLAKATAARCGVMETTA